MYDKHDYGAAEIWNLDGSNAQANKNDLKKVLARKGAKNSRLYFLMNGNG